MATLNVMLATKFAEAVVFAFRINVQVGCKVFGQTPPQFTNEEFAFGVAVSVIVVLFASDVPVGLWVTVPGPLEDGHGELGNGGRAGAGQRVADRRPARTIDDNRPGPPTECLRRKRQGNGARRTR